MTSLELQHRYTCSRLHFNYTFTDKMLSRDAGLDGAPLHFSIIRSSSRSKLLLVEFNQKFRNTRWEVEDLERIFFFIINARKGSLMSPNVNVL